jgi:hypothetical protein
MPYSPGTFAPAAVDAGEAQDDRGRVREDTGAIPSSLRRSSRMTIRPWKKLVLTTALAVPLAVIVAAPARGADGDGMQSFTPHQDAYGVTRGGVVIHSPATNDPQIETSAGVAPAVTVAPDQYAPAYAPTYVAPGGGVYIPPGTGAYVAPGSAVYVPPGTRVVVPADTVTERRILIAPNPYAQVPLLDDDGPDSVKGQ